MTTFAISTLGCKVNSYESEAYIAKCLELGYQQVDFKDRADLYLINTCAVTNTASSKSRQKIHAAVKNNPKAFVAVIGCYAQTANEEVKQIEGVDIIVGSDSKDEFLAQLPQLLEKKQRKNYVHRLDQPIPFETLPLDHFSTHTRAFLKVQDGCNQFCTYCIIPYARGRERSMPLDEAVALAQKLVDHGHREIVLAGIHTGRYGQDIQTNLCTLLKRMLQEVSGLQRIRLSSIEMNELSEEFIQLMEKEKRIAAHLHIPIQSGSDAILKAMHRPYTIQEYIDKIFEIRKRIPQISISTDIMTGFPNESEENHQETLQNLEKIQFTFMHVFPYSKREGTAAATMKNQVHGAIKKQRAHELNALNEKYRLNYYQSKIGQVLEVLVEKQVNGECYGYSSEYIPVRFYMGEKASCEVVKVKILEASSSECIGERSQL